MEWNTKELTHVPLNGVISQDLEQLSKTFKDMERRATSVRQLNVSVNQNFHTAIRGDHSARGP